MEGVAGNTLKVTRALNERNLQEVRTKWVQDVQGPLNKDAGTYENAFLYEPYRDKSEARKLLAGIALKIRVNTVPSLVEVEA